MSKVFRLNQVDATSALNYLGSLGAKVNVANIKTVTATSREESLEDGSGGLEATGSAVSESTVVESYGAEVGPLVGLVGTADARLNTLVLIGDPKLISVAEAYLKQIDLRKRQVAVEVQILNVALENDATIDSSFSSKLGNTFIVSESGKAHVNFGKYKPGRLQEGVGLYDAKEFIKPGIYPVYEPAVTDESNANGFKYPGNSFYSYLEAAVVSTNAKTLAQPTLLVQEGEKAVVRLASVLTGVEKSVGETGTQYSNTREDAGLTVEVEVEKIDDNGFVTLKLDPQFQPVTAGVQEGRSVFDINERSLKSGRIRLRDRQTLIYRVIQEDDRRLVNKWPILGDLPLIGQIFRRSASARQKNELVIIVTPSILDDDNGGVYEWV